MIDLELILRIFPQLLQGAILSLEIALLASLLGFTGGTILGVIQSNDNKILNWLVTIWVTIIRGTPMLLQITFLYLMLPHFGINISAFATAVLAIGINSSAYVSQIIRAGIKSVSRGQIEAAYTLGISKFDLTRCLILPQALKVVIPALGNEFVTLIKDSSLASLIGVLELYKRGEIAISQTYNSISVYIAIGLIYLTMTTLLTIIVNKTEDAMNDDARN